MTAVGSERGARALLVLGVVAGIALAGVSIVRSGRPESAPRDGAIALVNGASISREAFAQFVAAVASERGSLDLDAAQKRRLVERMVDEELLLQRGLELGLARHEPTARRAIVAAVVAAVTADAESDEPDEDALRAFHREHSDRFQQPGRVRVRAAFVSVEGRPEVIAHGRAAEIARRLRAGEDFASVSAALAEAPPAPLPEDALPLSTIRDYLGPSAALAVDRLQPGEVGDPVRGPAGYVVLELLERRPGETIAFEEVRDQVRAEFLRAAGDAALATYLAQLRAASDVEVLEPELVTP